MKRAAMVLGAVIFSLSVLIGAAQAAEKIAYMDLSRTFGEYNKTKEYDKVLAEKENIYTAEREKRVSEVKQFMDKFNLLSDKEKAAKEAEKKAKVDALQELDRQKETDLRKEQDEKMKELLKDIEDAVKQYSEKEGLDIVINDRVLVYQNKALEITDKVLDILNKKYKSK